MTMSSKYVQKSSVIWNEANWRIQDFPATGTYRLDDVRWFCWYPCVDYGGNIQDALKKAAAGPSDNLWEDNWDDDDVDDDFTKQLRWVVYHWNGAVWLTVYRTAIQERANAAADETMKE